MGTLITFLNWLLVCYKFIIVKNVNLYSDFIFHKQSFIFDSLFTIAWFRRWFVMKLSLGIWFSTYLYELLIIEIIFAEGGHRRDISPKLIYHKFQEEWLFCCLLLFEELFKRLLIPSLSQSFTFSRNKLSLETSYETVLMMIRKIFRHKQTIESEVTIYKNWLSSRNKTSYVQCIWRRSARLDVEVYVSLLLNLKIQTIS